MDDGSAWTILIDHTVFGLLEPKHSFVFVEKNQVVSLKNDAFLFYSYKLLETEFTCLLLLYGFVFKNLSLFFGVVILSKAVNFAYSINRMLELELYFIYFEPYS